MRHLKAGNRKFGRSVAHRKAMFRNMVTALVQRERIRTTLAKAKALRSQVEKVITLGKKGTVHARRLALKQVAQRETVLKVFGLLSERYAKRPGGYTRIIKIGPRRGDDAPMALIELVDREGEVKEPSKKEKGKKPTAAKKAETKKAPPKKKEKDEKKKEAKTKKSEGEKATDKKTQPKPAKKDK